MGGTRVAHVHRREDMKMQPRHSYRKLLGVVAAVLITLLTASPAAAGKTPPASYTCAVSVNPVTNGSNYYLMGSGYPAGMGVTVYIADSVQTFTYKGTINSKGTYSILALAGFS